VNYLNEFQQKELILPLLEKLKNITQQNYRFMEFCGGHTHALFKSGLIDLIPSEIKMIHGPGCPVCVLPAHPIKNCIKLLEQRDDIILATYADMMRVPTDEADSLLKARARGHQVIPLYGADDAIELAKQNPNSKIIFLAIGFETTIPATALVLRQAKRQKLNNFFVYCNHLNTAKALESILSSDLELDGLIGPGHVSLVTGSDFFNPYAAKLPLVISGFSAYDLAEGLYLLTEMVNQKQTGVKNQYKRAVTEQGNIYSQQALMECFELRESFEWRGLGTISQSAFKIKNEFENWDAEKNFSLELYQSHDHPHCLCSEVLFGQKNPLDCKLFAKACTPRSPLGPCMVSSEGACSAYYGRIQ